MKALALGLLATMVMLSACGDDEANEAAATAAESVATTTTTTSMAPTTTSTAPSTTTAAATTTTITTEAPTTTEPRAPVGAGDLETATGLMEQWSAAWNNNDREALGAIFAEDATLVITGVHSSTFTGRDEIARLTNVEPVHNSEVGEVTITEDGEFTCRGTYKALGLFEFVTELSFTLDGDLISHLVLHDEFATDEASG